MYANVYNEMKPHPTRCAASRSGVGAIRAAGPVRQSDQFRGNRQFRAVGWG